MSGLVLLWLVSLLLAGCAVAIMAVLIVARAVRTARQKRMEMPRKRLLALLLSVSDGGSNEAALAEARRRPVLTANIAVELFELVRGEDATRLATFFAASGLPDVLGRRLKRGDERARILAAETLAYLPGETPRALLQAALEDRSGEVRLAAAISLAEVGAAPPLDILIRQIGGATVEHSRRIVELFRRLSDGRRDELLAVAQSSQNAVTMRAAAIEAIVSSGDYTLVAPLSEIARNSTAPELVAQCVRGLGQLAHPNGIPVVEWALGNADWQVRAEAAEAAGRIGMVEAAPRLGSLLDDEVWWVRFRAGQALANLGATGRRLLGEIAEIGSGRSRRTAALVLAEQGSA